MENRAQKVHYFLSPGQGIVHGYVASLVLSLHVVLSSEFIARYSVLCPLAYFRHYVDVTYGLNAKQQLLCYNIPLK